MNPWDEAAKQVLRRPNTITITGTPMEVYGVGPPLLERRTHDCELERGVNFFVLALESMGALTTWSCEGHPTGFYIVFFADYDLALQVSRIGWFRVEVERRQNCFSMRLPSTSAFDEESKKQCLRCAALAWKKQLVPGKPKRKSGAIIKRANNK